MNVLKLFFRDRENPVILVLLFISALLVIFSFFKSHDFIWATYLIPFVLAFFVTILILLLSRYFEVFEKLRHFSRIEGVYRGYSCKDDNRLDWSFEPNSTVFKLTYLGNDNFNISADVGSGSKKGRKIWIGRMCLDSISFGKILWKYKIFEGKKEGSSNRRYGMKKVGIFYEGREPKIYLSEFENKRVGKELLLKIY